MNRHLALGVLFGSLASAAFAAGNYTRKSVDGFAHAGVPGRSYLVQSWEKTSDPYRDNAVLFRHHAYRDDRAFGPTLRLECPPKPVRCPFTRVAPEGKFVLVEQPLYRVLRSRSGATAVSNDSNDVTAYDGVTLEKLAGPINVDHWFSEKALDESDYHVVYSHHLGRNWFVWDAKDNSRTEERRHDVTGYNYYQPLGMNYARREVAFHASGEVTGPYERPRNIRGVFFVLDPVTGTTKYRVNNIYVKSGAWFGEQGLVYYEEGTSIKRLHYRTGTVETLYTSPTDARPELVAVLDADTILVGQGGRIVYDHKAKRENQRLASFNYVYEGPFDGGRRFSTLQPAEPGVTFSRKSWLYTLE